MLLLLHCFNLTETSFAQGAEKVYRLCYTQQPREWYEEQADLWKSKIEENPVDSSAWYSYYFANRYATPGTDEEKRDTLLNSIVDEIGEAIPNSYLYPYLKYYTGETKIEYLETAYQLNPHSSDLYWEIIHYSELNGLESNKKEFCEKLYRSNDIISSLFDYNYNMLNSTEKNSILFTNGDNDNYPAFILQEAKNIRKDVLVINAHTAFVLRDYLKMKFDEKGIEIDYKELTEDNIAVFLDELINSVKTKYPGTPVHVAPTVYESYLTEIKSHLFVTGLGYTYSQKPFDNIAIVKKNLIQNLRLDYLEYDWYNEDHVSQSMMDRYNLNYIPAFVELAKDYHSSGEIESANYWRDKALILAKKANDEALLKEIEGVMN